MVVHDQFDLQIPSESAAGQAIQERILKSLEDLQYPPRDVFGIRLALEEALVNAIKHGNGMDPSKQVRVTCSVTQDEIRIDIEDEGPGFDLSDVPDPTEEENLDRPGGRGIMLMRAFLNVVEYNSVGNRVTLVKRRGESNPDQD